MGHGKIACLPQGKPSWGVLFWSCGSCLSDMGRFEFFMGRFAAAHGGAQQLNEVAVNAAEGGGQGNPFTPHWEIHLPPQENFLRLKGGNCTGM